MACDISPRHAAIAVHERMYPKQAVVGGSRGDDGLGLADISVNLREAFEEAGHGAPTDGDMTSNLDIAMAKLAGHQSYSFFRLGFFDPEKILGKQLAKAPMNLADALGLDGQATFEAAAVNPLLDRDVRLRFELEVAFTSILIVVVFKRPLNIYGVRVMPLDEIGVVTVHRTDEIGKRRKKGRWQAARKACGLPGEVECQIGERSPVTGTLLDEERLHDGDKLTPIFRFYVRFQRLWHCCYKHMYIM